jgi:hypothetical protein
MKVEEKKWQDQLRQASVIYYHIIIIINDFVVYE